MPAVPKATLSQLNSDSFPNNNLGEITPADLRDFNSTMIASLVDEIPFGTYTASVDNSISAINTFTASGYPSYTALNSFSASQLLINTGYNSFTQSATGRLNNLESTTSSLNAFSSSINQILVNGTSIGTSTRFFFNGFVSASIIPNVNGAIASITVLSDPSLTTTASFNTYTASTATSISQSSNAFNQFSQSQNSFNLSATASLVELLNLSSSLSGGYATQGELDQSSSVLQANIDTKLNTSSFNAYTQSTNNTIATLTNTASFNSYTSSTNVRLSNLEITSASLLIETANLELFSASTNTTIANLNQFTSSVIAGYATTGSNVFVGNQTFTGSIYGNVSASVIASQTASIDLSIANYFTLTLSGSTNINVTNPRPGVTATLVINTSTGASASFSNNVKQPSGSFYAASPSGNIDIISFTAVNSNTVYAFPAQSFV
jgi:hypothetical protein